MKHVLLLAAAALTLSACGSSGEGSRASMAKEVLLADEIAQSSAVTAYDAVRLRRPGFLQTRGPKSMYASSRSSVRPAIYLNGLYHGQLETLNTIAAVEVQEIRYIDAKDATLLYGTGHVAGVIMVITKR
ncbi:MAG: hypothetical protein HYZ01_14970 [Ignavibacteriales bacterium]|nr:hypothetical protein [Ignavibacteriales bacterium]